MTTTKFEVSLPRKLARRFRVERVVGQGGFGVVLRAIQVGLDRAVALKLLLPEHTADPATRARFIQEARLVARLSNPCIVPVLDHGIEEDMAYIVFPFVEGASLRSQIETGGLSWAQVLGHALRIAEALAAIHEAGVVHRDLKPENVLLNEAGESFVTDFGVSKPLGTMVKTASGQILGTPGYLAPELVRGGEPAPGSDLYALGVMLWEMLSGFRPHQRGDPLDPGSTRPPLTALTRSVEADPPALPLSVSIPGPFEELIGRLVSRDPAARPRSTLEVLTLLQDLRARISDGQIGLATTARSSSPLVRGDAQQPTRLVLSQLDRSRREPPGFEPTLAIAGQTGAFRVLRILTGVGLALAVTVGLTSMAFRTVDQPAAVAAPVTATASTASPPGAPPSPGEADGTLLIRELKNQVEAAEMTVRPWDPVTADATSECPLVVTGLACLNGLELRSSGGGKAVSINDRPVAGGHFVSLRGRPAELREGLNWIKVTGGAADVAVRVRFFREPCEVPIRTPSQPPEDYRALDAIIALQQGGSLLPSLEEPVRRRIAQLFPNAGDPSRVAAVARLDLQRAANFDNVFDGLFAGRDPDWAFWLPKPDTIRHGRACMEARQAILQKYPDTWSSWHDLGYVLQNLRHLEAARHALVRALTIYPDALWSWYELHATDSRLFERTKSDRRTDARAAQRFRSAALRELDQVLRLAQGSPTELMKNPNWHRAFIAQMQRRRDEIDPRPRR